MAASSRDSGFNVLLTPSLMYPSASADAPGLPAVDPTPLPWTTMTAAALLVATAPVETDMVTATEAHDASTTKTELGTDRLLAVPWKSTPLLVDDTTTLIAGTTLPHLTLMPTAGHPMTDRPETSLPARADIRGKDTRASMSVAGVTDDYPARMHQLWHTHSFSTSERTGSGICSR